MLHDTRGKHLIQSATQHAELANLTYDRTESDPFLITGFKLSTRPMRNGATANTWAANEQLKESSKSLNEFSARNECEPSSTMPRRKMGHQAIERIESTRHQLHAGSGPDDLLRHHCALQVLPGSTGRPLVCRAVLKPEHGWYWIAHTQHTWFSDANDLIEGSGTSCTMR